MLDVSKNCNISAGNETCGMSVLLRVRNPCFVHYFKSYWSSSLDNSTMQWHLYLLYLKGTWINKKYGMSTVAVKF